MNLQKLRLGQLKPAATTEAGDTHFSKVTAMFNFDGIDGDTTTSGLDASNKNLTLSYSSGDQLSNTQKKFGATSLYVADNVTISTSDGFDMGTGDFTTEAWYYFTSFSSSFGIWDQWTGSSSGNSQVWMSSGSAGTMKWYYNGSSILSSSTTLSTGQWYHIVLTRHGGTLKFYINGTVDSSTQSFTGDYGKSGTVYLGDQHAGGGGAPLYYVDDLRVTKGLARYTGNFTAPTTAHLTSAGDVNKQILINSTADGVAIGTGGINQARIAKAWVNFNGSGTVAIRDSYNVSSITDNATGRWRVNFSTNLDNANFSVSAALGTVTGSGLATSALIHCGNDVEYAPSTSGFTLSAVLPSVSWQDPKYLSAQVFGN
jgi:hypothetical protein